MKTKETLLDREINRLRELLLSSQDKFNRLQDERERFAEKCRIENLQIQIRKLTTEANKEFNMFYCSRCGENFHSFGSRKTHVDITHGEEL